MRKSRCSLLITALLTVSLLTGCWDRVEIEQRGFVMAIGIDMIPKQEEEQKISLALTYQIAVPAKIQTGAGGREGGGGEQGGKPYVNMTTEGDTLFETVRIMATRSSRSLFFEHVKLVLIGEEVARSGYLNRVIDFLLRDHEMRRRMKVIVVKGEARKALDVMPKQERMTSEYLESLTENTKKTARMPSELAIGDLSEKIISKTSFVVQRVAFNEKELKMAGGAVIHGHNNKLVGWLDEEDTEALMWITGDLKGGITETVLPSGERVVYEIRTANTKIEPKVEKGKFYFHIQVESEGSLGESWENRDTLDKKFISEVEKAVEKDIQQSITDVIKKLQTELKADVAGLGSTLARKEPKVWEKVKNDWDHGKNYFRDAKVDVDVQVVIRFPGTISKLKGKE
ncbi:Ger(x)C family spore germination protein [Effusibacillus consociatus]|uniref:Ger(X)C family spore germination protein n=1 Tax=Effusibacillus consociatus TaxID=1117041 RepID=A0ABV9QAK7_9BACL